MAQVLYDYPGIHDLLPKAARILSELETKWAFRDEQLNKIRPKFVEMKLIEKRYYQILEVQPVLAKMRGKLAELTKKRDKYKYGQKESDKLRGVVAKKDDALQKIERGYSNDKKLLEKSSKYKALKKEREKLMKVWEKARKDENEYDRLDREVVELREKYKKTHNSLARNFGVQVVNTGSALVLLFGKKPAYKIPYN